MSVVSRSHLGHFQPQTGIGLLQSGLTLYISGSIIAVPGWEKLASSPEIAPRNTLWENAKSVTVP